MTLVCNCIDSEQRKLLLQAVGALIVNNRTDIDIWKEETELKKLKDIAVPYYEEQIQKLIELEKIIKEIPTCGPA